LIIGSATIFGWVATVSGVPQALGRWMFTLTENPYLLLLLANLLLLIAGMFLDAIPAILILGPILGPALVQFGVEPLHFAIIMCINVTVGLATPPMGLILFVASGLAKTGVEAIVKEMWPYLLVHITVIVLVSMLPILALGIPKLLGFM
ncbi:MAG: TRAP transporter large permease subunit, partial [Hyphomicrobiaceae bacterium]